MNIFIFLRQLRILGYAVFDLATALLGIYLLAPWLSKLFLKIGINIPKISWLYLTLPIGILAHLLIGRMTPMTAAFIDLNGSYVLKVVILALLALGVKDIKVVPKRSLKS